MSVQPHDLDDLIRREKSAWETPGAVPPPNPARLPAEVTNVPAWTTRPPIPTSLAVVGVVTAALVAGWFAMASRSGVHPQSPRAAVEPRAHAVAAPPSIPEATTDDGLARELAILRDAQLALRRGDASRALALAAQHEREFPSGTLAPERRAVVRRAACVMEQRAAGLPEDTCR